MNNTNPKPLLVVEDSPRDLYLLQNALLRAGCKFPIISSHSGDEARKFLDQILASPQPKNLPVAIIIDIMLRNGNGYQLLEWIRSKPELSEVVVVIMTGASNEEDSRRALSMGANLFFTKPTHYDELLVFGQNFMNWITVNRPSAV